MTNAEARFNKSLRPRKPEGSLGRTAQDGHLDSHTAPELWLYTEVDEMMLAVTCHLHFWQNDRDFLRATVVTRGWNGYRNKSQHRKSTLEKKILPPFQQGFEPATFQSRVRRSNHWAIPAPYTEVGGEGDYIPIATLSPPHSSGAVWESRWPSWAVRPNEPSGFRGRKAILNRASALVSACP